MIISPKSKFSKDIPWPRLPLAAETDEDTTLFVPYKDMDGHLFINYA